MPGLFLSDGRIGLKGLLAFRMTTVRVKRAHGSFPLVMHSLAFGADRPCGVFIAQPTVNGSGPNKDYLMVCKDYLMV